MNYKYRPKGVCSTEMNIELDGDIIKSVEIVGGCSGNSRGISSIVRGMKAQDVIERFDGVTCGFKGTSCPDQLARALKEALQKQN